MTVKRIVLTACMAAIGAGVIGQVSAADGARSSGVGGETERFTLQQPNDVAEFVDLGAPGPSAGDKVFFHGDVVRDGRTVGTQRGSCEAVQPNAGALHCYLTVRFGSSLENTVEAAGEFFLNPDGTVTSTAVFSIVGGTGHFIHSSGQITITNLSPSGAKAREDWMLRR